MSEQVWLPLIRSSSPQTLGQAVLRLAALAEAAHMRQVTEAFVADDSVDSNDVWADGPAPGSAPGFAPGFASQDVAAEGPRGRDHKEVGR